MVTVTGTATVDGPQGLIEGWLFQVSMQDGTANGTYGSINELMENRAEQLGDALTQFVADQLVAEYGVTSVTWTSVQVTRPSVEVLHEEP